MVQENGLDPDIIHGKLTREEEKGNFERRDQIGAHGSETLISRYILVIIFGFSHVIFQIQYSKYVERLVEMSNLQILQQGYIPARQLRAKCYCM